MAFHVLKAVLYKEGHNTGVGITQRTDGKCPLAVSTPVLFWWRCDRVPKAERGLEDDVL
jgi:hypothetical protein